MTLAFYVSLIACGLVALVGLFLTFRLGFIQFRFFSLAIKTVSGQLDLGRKKETITHFQAHSFTFAFAFILSTFGLSGQGPTFKTLGLGLALSILLMPIQYALVRSIHSLQSAATSLVAMATGVFLLGSYAVATFAGYPAAAIGFILVLLSVFFKGNAARFIFPAIIIATIASFFTGRTNPPETESSLIGFLPYIMLGFALLPASALLLKKVRTSELKAGLSGLLQPLSAFGGFAAGFGFLSVMTGINSISRVLFAICIIVILVVWAQGIREIVLTSFSGGLRWGILTLCAIYTAAGGIIHVSPFHVMSESLIAFIFVMIGSLSWLWACLVSVLRRPDSDLIDFASNPQIKFSSKDAYLIFLTILPQNFVSRMFGLIAGCPLPKFLRPKVYLWYARSFGVNVEDAEKEISEYRSLNTFFTRDLKPGLRPLEGDARTVVSPVDGTVLRFGDLKDGMMLQAKGFDYSVGELLDSERYAAKFIDGKYVIIYLSPRDYHKIHFPCDGKVPGYTYTPGDLFTVSPMAAERLSGLFSKNERLTTYIENPAATVALVKVGATNVGSIRIEYESFVTNRWVRIRRERVFDSPIVATKGQEMARFQMGSTVILFFEKGKVDFLPLIQEKQGVKLGQAIARFL